MRADVTGNGGAGGAPAWAGATVLLTLVLHFGVNPSGTERPIELLWSCYAASLLLGLAILVRWNLGASAGCVFHVAVGLPAYLMDVASGGSTGSTTVSAALAHVVAPVVGVWHASRAGLDRRAWLVAWCLIALTQQAALLTDPALNINVVYAPWQPVAGLFDSIALYRVTNLALAMVMLYLAQRMLQLVLPRPPALVGQDA